MKKLWIILVIFLVAVVAYFIYSFGESSITPPGDNEVNIQNFAYNPSNITISVGETIKWINLDSAEHTVTSNEGNELDSEFLAQNEVYEHTFNEAGVYEYHCIPHPWMTGVVSVK